MDIATIIGLVGGTILVFLAIITGGDLFIFFNIPGLLIVVGGTIATCFIKFSMADVLGICHIGQHLNESYEGADHPEGGGRSTHAFEHFLSGRVALDRQVDVFFKQFFDLRFVKTIR